MADKIKSQSAIMPDGTIIFAGAEYLPAGSTASIVTAEEAMAEFSRQEAESTKIALEEQ